MLAVIYEQFQGPLELRRVSDPTPPQDGVVVRVAANGICRSDWHGWQGHDADIRLPHVPGHELAGVIEAVGVGVRRCPSVLSGWRMSLPPTRTRAKWGGAIGPIAQRLEQATHNRLVGGSNPSGPTSKKTPDNKGESALPRLEGESPEKPCLANSWPILKWSVQPCSCVEVFDHSPTIAMRFEPGVSREMGVVAIIQIPVKFGTRD